MGKSSRDCQELRLNSSYMASAQNQSPFGATAQLFLQNQSIAESTGTDFKYLW